MIGIVAYGAYIPILRLSRDEIAKAWGRYPLQGERSVANNDEDTVTMAVEAAFDCLGDIKREEVDGLFFASTTAPYREKQSACLVGTVVDLKQDMFTVDYANSLRAGCDAMKMAFHMVKSGVARNVLVTASECRLGYPRSDFEQNFGDGAGAVVIGESKVIAKIESTYCNTNEMVDVWRKADDTFVQSWEGRWVLEQGYIAMMEKAVRGIMERSNLEAKDIQKVILPAPDARTHKRLSNRLGFSDLQIQDPLITSLGYCGNAQPLLMLSCAFEEAKPGDKILLASYGDGADAFLFEVTEEIQRFKMRRAVSGFLSSKLMIPSYERYLSFRGLLETEPGEPSRLLPSATVSWRDRESVLRFHGSRCRQCGLLTYPLQRICYSCKSKDDYREERLSGRRGKVFTFSLDNLAGRKDDPTVVQTVVELDEEDTRVYCMMTDCVPSQVKIGIPVEFTFRRLYEGAGFYNYFWKCRQVR